MSKKRGGGWGYMDGFKDIRKYFFTLLIFSNAGCKNENEIKEKYSFNADYLDQFSADIVVTANLSERVQPKK